MIKQNSYNKNMANNHTSLGGFKTDLAELLGRGLYLSGGLEPVTIIDATASSDGTRYRLAVSRRGRAKPLYWTYSLVSHEYGKGVFNYRDIATMRELSLIADPDSEGIVGPDQLIGLKVLAHILVRETEVREIAMVDGAIVRGSHGQPLYKTRTKHNFACDHFLRIPSDDYADEEGDYE